MTNETNSSVTRDVAMTLKNLDESRSRLENPTAVFASVGYLHTSKAVDRFHSHLLSQETPLPKLGKSGHGR
jgi:hypothetical protein